MVLFLFRDGFGRLFPKLPMEDYFYAVKYIRVPKNPFELDLPLTCTSFYELSGLKKLSIWVGFWTPPYPTHHSWSRTYCTFFSPDKPRKKLGSPTYFIVTRQTKEKSQSTY
jgi:hypothetical protein